MPTEDDIPPESGAQARDEAADTKPAPAPTVPTLQSLEAEERQAFNAFASVAVEAMYAAVQRPGTIRTLFEDFARSYYELEAFRAAQTLGVEP